jgi:hypothetical protein
MKNILIIALTLIAFAANAQTPAAKETTKATISVNASNATDVQAPIATPATEETPAAAPTAVGAPDNSAKFVGTNDLNLYLLRQGVKKA